MAEGKIIIIDSDEKNNQTMKIVLANLGYEVSVAFNGKYGVDAFSMNRFDVVYLAMNIRDIDPLYIIREFKKRDLDIVIVALIPSDATNFIKEASSQGVYDYMKKPSDPQEIFFTAKRAMAQRKYLINNRLALRSLEERNISLQKQNIMLARRIEESTRNLTHLYEDLRDTYMRTIKALAQAIDARDHYTHSHSTNVSRYANIMASEMGLDTHKVEEITDACQLHDLGKIGIHDYVLTKPGKLTPEEFEEVKLHALKGAQILEPLTFLEGVIRIVKQHHERYDGKGYPYGLKGDQIDIGARIMAIADTYDAMTSARPYRTQGVSKEETIEEIKNGSGTQFDPKVVEVFLKVVHRM